MQVPFLILGALLKLGGVYGCACHPHLPDFGLASSTGRRKRTSSVSATPLLYNSALGVVSNFCCPPPGLLLLLGLPQLPGLYRRTRWRSKPARRRSSMRRRCRSGAPLDVEMAKARMKSKLPTEKKDISGCFGKQALSGWMIGNTCKSFHDGISYLTE